MATSIRPIPRGSVREIDAARTREHALARLQAAAGITLLLAGFIILMGIITAESVYPDTFTTHDNEISDLGATMPPNSIIRQPSAHIFNATMMASGIAILLATALLQRTGARRRAVISVGLLGLGALGVGIFPGNRAPMHGLFAMLAFVSGGVAAILVGTTITGAFRVVSIALGAIVLGSLVIALLGDTTPVLDHLGDGGIERWVAYPEVIWIVAFGAYLMNQPTSAPGDRSTPGPATSA